MGMVSESAARKNNSEFYPVPGAAREKSLVCHRFEYMT